MAASRRDFGGPSPSALLARRRRKLGRDRAASAAAAARQGSDGVLAALLMQRNWRRRQSAVTGAIQRKAAAYRARTAPACATAAHANGGGILVFAARSCRSVRAACGSGGVRIGAAPHRRRGTHRRRGGSDIGQQRLTATAGSGVT